MSDTKRLQQYRPAANEPAFKADQAVVLRWTLPLELHGMRADRALVARVRRLSRTRAQHLIKSGDFRLTTGPLKPGTRLRGGAEVELWRFPPDEEDPTAEKPGIIFSDRRLLVVHKPGDLAVHPSARYLRRTLTHWLAQNRRDDIMAHPCHRLDRETSGVLLCAWEKKTEAAIKIAFAEGRVTKTYLAVVDGMVEQGFECKVPLALQGDRGLVRIRMIEDAAGLECGSIFVPLFIDREQNRTLVACRPLSGRQHQLRAHLAICGHPILGDKLYAMGDAWFDRFTKEGIPEDGGGLVVSRQALHAARAQFSLDDEPFCFSSHLPRSMEALFRCKTATGATPPDWVQAGEDALAHFTVHNRAPPT